MEKARRNPKTDTLLMRAWLTLENWPPFMHIWFRYGWKPKAGSIQYILDRYSSKNPGLNFIQVGANDGHTNDPIYKFVIRDSWKGLVLEPQKNVFQSKLVPKLGKRPHLILLNVAISATDEIRTLYKISFSTARWATGLATFLKETMVDRVQSDYVATQAALEGVDLPESIDARISEEPVQCRSFNSLLDEYRFTSVNLLQIDTEGFDFEIIKMFPFNRVKPDVISFETENLNPADMSACTKMLEGMGYSMIFEKGNAVAYDRIALDIG